MGADSKIEWTDHTFNAWWGCVRVSPGCEHCYAEAFAKRTGHKVWGVEARRRFFGEKHWSEPHKWNAAAKKAGVRRRVFCGSMMDVFELPKNPDTLASLNFEREKLWLLIEDTPDLDWLALTKRPENASKCLPSDWLESGLPSNVWMGTTVEDQRRANERIPHLLRIPAAIRFLSCEPLVESVRIDDIPDDEIPGAVLKPLVGLRWAPTGRGMRLIPNAVGPLIHWVICGGESGGGARPFDLAWARSLRDQCKPAGVSFFFKQAGDLVVDSDRVMGTFAEHDARSIRAAKELGRSDNPPNLVLLRTRKGGNLDELAKDAWSREFPRLERSIERLREEVAR